jgi:hypothetical protein
MDAIPIFVLFFGTIILIVIAISFGFWAGNKHHPELKKNIETITSANSAAILGLLGFMLVFTFGIVYDRYDSKKELVREEANIIRTVWQRADFLPEQDRLVALKLLQRYVDMRIKAVQSNIIEKVHLALKESNLIQKQLWDMAVVNARKDMNSDVAALYIESLNDLININAIRISIGLQVRIPIALWVIIYLLVFLGMFTVGYQAAVTGTGLSKGSLLTGIMILTFSIIITLIASLDRSQSTIISVSQQPLIELRTWMGVSL